MFVAPVDSLTMTKRTSGKSTLGLKRRYDSPTDTPHTHPQNPNDQHYHLGERKKLLPKAKSLFSNASSVNSAGIINIKVYMAVVL